MAFLEHTPDERWALSRPPANETAPSHGGSPTSEASSLGQSLTRRNFLARSVLAVSGVTASIGNSSEAPLSTKAPTAPAGSPESMPQGKLGKLTISRLISGGNLIGGWAHSRDLYYVPELMRHYNTDEKVMDTLELLEQHGVNALVCDPSEKTFRILGDYWKRRGGKIQWIAEGHPRTDDWKTNIQKSIDFGAAAIYVQGVIGDRWLKEKSLDLLGGCVDMIKSQGRPAGIGAHRLDVIVQSETNKYGADFYVKTLHHNNYWSRRRIEGEPEVIDSLTDNYWDRDPEKTAAFMQQVEKPWIAFKVLAAGAIRPESGFRYAFQNGADFICVGMFDWQVSQNVALVRSILGDYKLRERGWWA